MSCHENGLPITVMIGAPRPMSQVSANSSAMRKMSASMRPIGMPANPAMADERVVPAITRMKSAVNTTSMITTAQNAKCAGEWSAEPFDAPPNSA